MRRFKRIVNLAICIGILLSFCFIGFSYAELYGLDTSKKLPINSPDDADSEPIIEPIIEPILPLPTSEILLGETIDDPYLIYQWAFESEYLNCVDAWDHSKGEGVVVAVIDSGIDTDHPDIAANLWFNLSEDLNGNGVFDPGPPGEGGDVDGLDTDGNTYPDDFFGWDFFGNTDVISDFFGTGTPIAGVIAAPINNIGIVGVAPEAKIMTLKVIEGGGGKNLDGIKPAVQYAIDKEADIICFGFTINPYDSPSAARPIIHAKLEDINQKLVEARAGGCLIITAAGDDSADVVGNRHDVYDYYWPASLSAPDDIANSTAVAVSGTDQNELERWVASNYGDEIMLSAPADRILSLRADEIILSNFDDPQYNYANSTALAAAHVAGVAALVKAQHPEYTPQDILNRIIWKNHPTELAVKDLPLPPAADPLNAWDLDFGWGRVSAFKVLHSVAPPLNLEVVKPVIITDGNDYNIDPGETAYVKIKVKNIDTETTAYNVAGTLTILKVNGVKIDPADPNPPISVMDGDALFGNIAPGETKEVLISYTPRILARPDADFFWTIDFNLSLTADGDYYDAENSIHIEQFIKAEGQILNSAAISDIDDDDSLEIVFGDDAGNVYCYAADGQLKWKYELGFSITSPITIAQLDALDPGIMNNPPTAYYPCNDNAAAPDVDDYRDSYEAMLKAGGVDYNTDNVSTAGKISRGLELDGVDTCIDCGDIAELNNVSEFSLCGWFKQDVLDREDTLFMKYKDADDHLQVSTHTDGTLQVKISSGGSAYTATLNDYSDFVAAGTFFHLVVAVDLTEDADWKRIKVYIDGLSTSERITYAGTAPATTPDLSTANLLIGNTTDSFDGVVDDIRVYGQKLSFSQIEALYDMRHQPTPDEYEILFGADGKLYCLNCDGSRRWSRGLGVFLEAAGITLDLGYDGEIITAPAAVDLDCHHTTFPPGINENAEGYDEYPEIIFTDKWQPHPHLFIVRQKTDWGSNTVEIRQVLDGAPHIPYQNGPFGEVAVGDVNHDLNQELFAGTYNSNLYCFERQEKFKEKWPLGPQVRYYKYVLRDDDEFINNEDPWPFDGGNEHYQAKPVLMDVVGSSDPEDVDLEIIFGGTKAGNACLYIINFDAEELSSYDTGIWGLVETTPRVANIDADASREEIIFSVNESVEDGEGNHLGTATKYICLEDHDVDGEFSQRWSFSSDPGSTVWNNSAALVDLDGGGPDDKKDLEIVFGADRYIYYLNKAGRKRANSYRIDGEVLSPTAVADLDHDGWPEIIVGSNGGYESNHHGVLYVFDAWRNNYFAQQNRPICPLSQAQPWPMASRDLQRSGMYTPGERPPRWQAIPQKFTCYGDCKGKFYLEAFDAEGPVTYSMQNAPAGATLTSYGMGAFFEWTPPATDVSYTHEVTITVEDQSGLVCTSLVTLDVEAYIQWLPIGNLTTPERIIFRLDIEAVDALSDSTIYYNIEGMQPLTFEAGIAVYELMDINRDGIFSDSDKGEFDFTYRHKLNDPRCDLDLDGDIDRYDKAAMNAAYEEVKVEGVPLSIPLTEHPLYGKAGLYGTPWKEGTYAITVSADRAELCPAPGPIKTAITIIVTDNDPPASGNDKPRPKKEDEEEGPWGGKPGPLPPPR